MSLRPQSCDAISRNDAFEKQSRFSHNFDSKNGAFLKTSREHNGNDSSHDSGLGNDNGNDNDNGLGNCNDNGKKQRPRQRQRQRQRQQQRPRQRQRPRQQQRPRPRPPQLLRMSVQQVMDQVFRQNFLPIHKNLNLKVFSSGPSYQSGKFAPAKS